MDVLKRINHVKTTRQTKLHLSNSQLKEIPKEIYQLTNLVSLNLYDNQLTEIPIELTQMTNLGKLELSVNKLTKLPDGFENLINLRVLNLGSNQFEEIPRVVFKLINLRALGLDFNLIEKIPDKIVKLKNLQMLILDWNQIVELPKEIVCLTNLKVFSIQFNPLKTPPIEIAERGIQEIRNYFESLERGIQKLYEAKLILVGQGGVGKTCLTEKLVNEYYNITRNEPTTEGIAIKEWSWPWAGIEGKTNFQVNIWDFGGQEIYHATHQFFLTQRSLYLFVWEARQDEDYSLFDFWLNVISLLSNYSPVIVVLNKADERTKQIDQASLVKKFNNIVGFHQVSCLNGNGIKDLTTQIKETIVNLPHVGVDWPQSWTEIRRRLKKDSRDYIEYADYKNICDSHGLDEEKANYLSSFLHDLGVILHFQDDPILRNLVILKPDWGTNAVYKVLDTNEVQNAKGRFHFNDLWKIWKDCYPPSKYHELLRLMIKFELCFNLADSDDYIVPELLSPEEPKLNWNQESKPRFEYRYEFMPAGILTRFIARNHTFIDNNLYWKNGVILGYQNARALITGDPLSKKVSVYTTGTGEQNLVALIRGEFEHIHKTLNNPALNEMVSCICTECKSGSLEQAGYYDIEDLKRYVSKNKKTIECRKSLEDVQVEQLISGLITVDVPSEQPSNVFISYSHKDVAWLEKLKTHFKPYVRTGNIIPWDDTMIKTGDRWRDKIEKALKSAKVAVLLVSPDFLASEFIAQHELPPLLEAAKTNGIIIHWIAISSSSYQETEIEQYQCTNNPDKPLDSLSTADQNRELVNICIKIKKDLARELSLV